MGGEPGATPFTFPARNQLRDAGTGVSALAGDLPGGCRALIFDFNGTLSDDEPIMYRVFAEMFEREGRPLSIDDYQTHLAGHADEEIIRRWLGHRDDLESLVARRIEAYRLEAADGRTVSMEARRAVTYAAARAPLAIVSGAALSEISTVLRAAGLDHLFCAVVASDHVRKGKPNPEGYLTAVGHLRGRLADLEPNEVVAFEDTDVGVKSATGAGLRCIAIAGTLPRTRLGGAHDVVDRIDMALMRRLVG